MFNKGSSPINSSFSSSPKRCTFGTINPSSSSTRTPSPIDSSRQIRKCYYFLILTRFNSDHPWLRVTLQFLRFIHNIFAYVDVSFMSFRCKESGTMRTRNTSIHLSSRLNRLVYEGLFKLSFWVHMAILWYLSHGAYSVFSRDRIIVGSRGWILLIWTRRHAVALVGSVCSLF